MIGERRGDDFHEFDGFCRRIEPDGWEQTGMSADMSKVVSPGFDRDTGCRSYATTIVPSMLGWRVHVLAYVPGSSKVTL